MNDLKNKTVLVTGGSRGIGREICLEFAKAGANVIINYLNSEQKAIELETELKKFNVGVLTVKGDVSNFEDSKNIVEKSLDSFERIDILVNNSGITKDNLMIRMSEADFDKVVNVNLKGTWNMCKNITRHMMKNRDGVILNITSVVGLIGNPGQSNYVASKAGVIGLTKTLAKEFGSRNIRVNAIAPGFIETEMTNNLNEELKENYLKQIPLNKFGKAKDVANLCVFLASEEANYITGQVISVNGGMV